MITAINDSVSFAALLNESKPATDEDAQETPLDWVKGGMWLNGETYTLDPEATTSTLAVLADGTAAIRHSPAWSREGCAGGHRTAVEGEAEHWCPADLVEWSPDGSGDLGVTRDWRAVTVFDGGFSQTDVHATIEEATAAFDRERAEMVKHYRPQVTVDLVCELLASPAEDPALYVEAAEDPKDAPKVSVWASALIPGSRLIVNRVDVVDAIGEDPSTDDITEYLHGLQEDTDAITLSVQED